MRHGERNSGNRETIKDLRIRIYDLRIMKVKDFKAGDTVLVRAQLQSVSHYYEGNLVHFASIDAHGDIICDSSFSLFEHEMAAVVKQDEVKPRPKHDPCRKFRKGDVVRVVERDGRKIIGFPVEFIQAGDVLTVAEDENLLHVDAFTANGSKVAVAWLCLELVTPVEELKPYKVVHTRGFYSVEDKKLNIVASYSCKLHPHAKEAAEAEGERLNDEWQTKVCRSEEGKEENND